MCTKYHNNYDISLNVHYKVVDINSIKGCNVVDVIPQGKLLMVNQVINAWL